MSLCNYIAECLTGRADDDDASYTLLSEKPLSKTTCNPVRRTSQEIAADVVSALLHAEKPGRELELKLHDIVTTNGWTESIALAVFNGIQEAIQNGAPMGQAMFEACQKATSAAKEFALDHPIIVCSVLAVGILIILSPWILTVLGFAEAGPVEGSCAAWWQSTMYRQAIPKGSIFSFFQRLGMKYGLPA
ncbi:hypothetical protein BDZ91DRAFT_687538 [Kalaharituber pfeilii]|nr:hypothetical protein BDZ91DRAFT_687538 [Kalaharituber pfeilii]